MTTTVCYRTKEGAELTATLLVNKGIQLICLDADGNEIKVPKGRVIETWEEGSDPVTDGVEAAEPSFLDGMQDPEEDAGPVEQGAEPDPEDPPAGPSELSGLIQPMTTDAPPAEEGPVLVSLADICAEVQVVPRIARRRLRKAKGILTEGRWEFAPEQVAEIKALILGTTVKAAE